MSNIWTQPETVPDNTTLASFILNYLLAKSSDKRELNHDLVMIEGKRSRKSKSVFNPGLKYPCTMDRLWLKSGLIIFKAEQQHMSAVKSSCLILTCNSCKACENLPKAKKIYISNKEPLLIQRMFLKKKSKKTSKSFQSCDWQVVKNNKEKKAVQKCSV